MVSNYSFTVSTSDTTLLTQYITQYMKAFLAAGPPGDVLCVFALTSHFPSMFGLFSLLFLISFAVIVSVVNSIKPNLKLAAFFIPTNTFTDQQLKSVCFYPLFNSVYINLSPQINPSGWLAPYPFLNTSNYGTSGILGGTSAEFYTSFSKLYGAAPNYPSVVHISPLQRF